MTGSEMNLSKTQSDVLHAIAGWRGPGLPLSGALAELIGLANHSCVRYNLLQLQDKGLLDIIDVHNRKLPRLTPAGRKAIGLTEAPAEYFIEKGFDQVNVFPIRCGALAEAHAEVQVLTSPAQLFRCWRDGDYLLTCLGDSMEPEICEGDWAQLRPGIAPANGEIVHAEYVLDGGLRECTLKVFELIEHLHEVRLRAFNAEYAVIALPAARVEVRGVVLEVLKRRIWRTGKRK